MLNWWLQAVHPRAFIRPVLFTRPVKASFLGCRASAPAEEAHDDSIGMCYSGTACLQARCGPIHLETSQTSWSALCNNLLLVLQVQGKPSRFH